MTPAQALANYIASKTSHTLGGNLFVSAEPDKPDTCLTIYDTGGRDPIDNLGYCERVRQPSVQIRSRSMSYSTAYEQIKDLLDVVLGVAHYTKSDLTILEAQQRSDIIAIGKDDNKRSLITVNFDLLTKGA